MFASEISKEEINTLDTRHFEGRIHLVDTPDKFEGVLPGLSHQPILGFDTESRPSFKKGESHDISLIQLSTNTDAWLFRINKIGLPEKLLDIFEDGKILKIGAGLHDDFNRLNHLLQNGPSKKKRKKKGPRYEWKNNHSVPVNSHDRAHRKLKPEGFVDLQTFVEEFNIESKSLKKITAIILGFKISKSQQLSNWEVDDFTKAQMLYAATDAWVCYEIFKKLEKTTNNKQ